MIRNLENCGGFSVGAKPLQRGEARGSGERSRCGPDECKVGTHTGQEARGCSERAVGLCEVTMSQETGADLVQGPH